MTTINITRSDEKATAILRAIRMIDEGTELTPIVRCQSCKHWDTNHTSAGQGWCPKIVGYRSSDWFCAAGERKNL